ncbi:pyocin knob domain-containing protein [Rosenbergiella gaditana]|uniref:pyocin knob domain-containing protein n=1 Tax=Rosenbergiella gaditana TaxID=2726987 RepID=UPI001BD9147F|nr:pyocin knob domain-containing protein [Rosenbergiella gaditana]
MTKDALTANETGAVPMADKTLPAGTDQNGITTSGQYFQNVTNNATLLLNYPEAVAGVLVVHSTGVDDGGCRQGHMPYNSTLEYRRSAGVFCAESVLMKCRVAPALLIV